MVSTAALLVLLATAVTAAETPMTLLSDDEAEPIRSAITRKEAWTQEPSSRLRAEAERRLKEGLWTVTADRPKNINLDPHDYYSEAPYWWPNPDDHAGPYIRRDGHTNPDRFTANQTALNSMADAVFSLGAAAYLLDDARYAQRAARLANTWFINPKTRMNPNLEHAQAVLGINTGRSAGIIDGRVFIRAIQGMEFLEQTGAWDAKDQAAVKKWFEDYLRWLTASKNGADERDSGNNRASWWTAQVAAVANFVPDASAEKMAFNSYRDRVLARQIRADGSAPLEEERNQSLSDSAFNLEAYVWICRIAQEQGVDLWSARAKSGATIGTVIDYLSPYFSKPRKWPKEQISDFRNDGLYYLAFAGMGLKKPEYVALFRNLERPEGA